MNSDPVLITLHGLHVLFGAFWIGSLLYTELVLWPELRRIGQLGSIQAELRTARVRKLVAIGVVGTIVTGYLRGVAAGVLDRLQSPYGVLFIASAVIGIAMLAWWATFPTRDRKVGWFLFYSSFAIIFPLMVALRFVS